MYLLWSSQYNHVKARKKQGAGRTIRVSVDVYNKICELGKTNDSFTSVVDRIFKKNNLIGDAEKTENVR